MKPERITQFRLGKNEPSKSVQDSGMDSNIEMDFYRIAFGIGLPLCYR